MRILVAEDNDTNWKVINKILESYGIDAKRAINGKVAVEMLQNSSKPYDLIFMDIQMPVMNGYEAVKAIRRLTDAEKAATPIFAMTADTFASDIEKCKTAGMNGHLSKPIEMKKVIEIIQTIDETRAKKGKNR
ncbi:MAG: response regulator [Oscillospiraceae bacterium]|nr:response regulator [Oscillospiraceae bacterium]